MAAYVRAVNDPRSALLVVRQYVATLRLLLLVVAFSTCAQRRTCKHVEPFCCHSAGDKGRSVGLDRITASMQ
jgi:hypothetical protein